MESKLLAALIASREAYDTVAEYLEPSSFSPAGSTIFRFVTEYYDTDKEAKYCDADILRGMVDSNVAEGAMHDQMMDVIATLEEKEVSISNVVKQVLEKQRRDIGHELAQCILTEQSKQKQEDMVEKYQSIIHRQTLDVDIDEEYQSPDLTELASTHFAAENLVPIAPKSLNERLGGGLPPGTHMVLGARPECYDSNTEVLTDKGWVFFNSLTDHKVAQVHNDRNITFVKPLDYIKYYMKGNLISIKDGNGRCDLVVTKNHNVVQDKDGKLVSVPAKEAKWSWCNRLPTSGITTEASAGLTPDQRLWIAFQADGSYVSQVKNGACTGARSGCLPIRFTLTKERKRKRLEAILKETLYNYTYEDTKGGKRVYYIKIPCTKYAPNKTFSWVKPATRSVEWLRAFVEELSYWDATRRTEQRYKYDTTVKENADVVQEVCALCGYTTNHSVFVDNRKETFSDVHSITIRTGYKPISGSCITQREVAYKGNVYCVTVPTGRIIVRRNNCVSVCGNCGKTATALTIACAAANQGYPVLYYCNEEPVINIIFRAVSHLAGMTTKDIRANPAKAQELALKRGFDNIVFVYASRNSPWEIKALAKKHKPKLIIVDQLRNINIGMDKLTEILERGAKAMRDIAAQCHCVVVSITQAGDSAEGKAELGMSDIDSSKTGIQGACDIILLMGVNLMLANSGRRCFNLVKNKTTGNHDAWYININDQLSRITD